MLRVEQICAGQSCAGLCAAWMVLARLFIAKFFRSEQAERMQRSVAADQLQQEGGKAHHRQTTIPHF